MRRLLAPFLVLASCGSRDCPSADPMPAHYEPVAATIRECTGLDGEPPLWIEVGSQLCRDKRGWCLEGNDTKGARYISACRTVVIQALKPEYGAHELIHHYRRINGLDGDRKHESRHFTECDPTR